jgi:uncharacterized protein (DUF433 family)
MFVTLTFMDRAIPGFPRLTVNPNKPGGKPCVRGLRISVRDVMRALGSYPSHEALLADHPDLEEPDLVEVASFAAVMSAWDDVAWSAA